MKTKEIVIIAILSTLIICMGFAMVHSDSIETDAGDVQNDNVAKIGETEYATLMAALDAVEEGQTIELLSDCTFELPGTPYLPFLTTKENVTINGYDKTITMNVGDVDLKNGASFVDVKFVGSGNNIFNIFGDGEGSTAGVRDISFSGCTFSGTCLNCIQFGNAITAKGKLTITDCTFENANCSNRDVRVSLAEDATPTDTVITITGCTLTAFDPSAEDKDTPIKITIDNVSSFDSDFYEMSDNTIAGNAMYTCIAKNAVVLSDSPEAKIGDEYYLTFVAAVNNADAGDTIEILRDITLNEMETFEALEGKETVTVDGKIDDENSHTVEIKMCQYFDFSVKLHFKSVIFVSCIYYNMFEHENNPDVVINITFENCTFKTDDGDYLRVFQYYSLEEPSIVTYKKCVFEMGTGDSRISRITSADVSQFVTMNDCTITGVADDDMYIKAVLNDEKTYTIEDALSCFNVNGTTINGEKAVVGFVDDGEDKIVFLTYESYFEAYIGNVYYKTFAEAISAAKSNDEIVLVKDVTVSSALTIGSGITLTIPEGVTLTTDEATTVNGKLAVMGAFVSSADLTNNGTIVAQVSKFTGMTGNVTMNSGCVWKDKETSGTTIIGTDSTAVFTITTGNIVLNNASGLTATATGKFTMNKDYGYFQGNTLALSGTGSQILVSTDVENVPTVTGAYKITFNLNSEGECDYGYAFVVDKFTTIPDATATTSDFIGWYTSSTGGDKVTTNTTFSADTEIFAHWEKKEVTVTFDMNGHGTQIDPVTIDMGTKLTKPADPSESGYTFGGWFKESACVNAWNFNDTVDKDMTLYAKWTVSTITVTFDANGGTTPSPSTKDVTPGKAYGTLATTSRTGCTFDGWYTSATGGTLVTATSIVSLTAVNHTLYAQWSVTVTFDSNGGSTPSFATKTVKIGSTYGDLPTTQWDHHTFDGWMNSSGEQITSSTVVTIASNHTLTASWNVDKFELSYNANGGSGQVPPSSEYEYGSEATVLFTPIPEKGGYRFLGWSTDASATEAEYTTYGEKTITIASNTTLYAIYKEVEVEKYIINASAGKGGSIAPGSCEVELGGGAQFVIYADENYKVSDVIVDGVSVGAQNRYAFTDVRADHTIYVEFEYSEGTETEVDPSTGYVTETTTTTEGTTEKVVVKETAPSGETTVSAEIKNNETGIVTVATNDGTEGTVSTIIPAESVAKETQDVAVVTDKQVDEAVEQSKKAAEATGTTGSTSVTIAVESSGSESTKTTSASISEESMKSIKESNADMRVVSKTGTVVVDKETVSSLASKGGVLTLSIGEGDKSSLTPEQKKKVGDNYLIDAAAFIDDTPVHDLGGKVTVAIPYELKEGDDPDKLVVWYVDEEGTTEKFDASYSKELGCVVFETTHFSYYMISFGDIAPEKKSDNTMLYIGIAACVIIAALVIAFLLFRKNKSNNQL